MNDVLIGLILAIVIAGIGGVLFFLKRGRREEDAQRAAVPTIAQATSGAQQQIAASTVMVQRQPTPAAQRSAKKNFFQRNWKWFALVGGIVLAGIIAYAIWPNGDEETAKVAAQATEKVAEEAVETPPSAFTAKTIIGWLFEHLPLVALVALMALAAIKMTRTAIVSIILGLLVANLVFWLASTEAYLDSLQNDAIRFWSVQVMTALFFIFTFKEVKMHTGFRLLMLAVTAFGVLITLPKVGANVRAGLHSNYEQTKEAVGALLHPEKEYTPLPPSQLLPSTDSTARQPQPSTPSPATSGAQTQSATYRQGSGNYTVTSTDSSLMYTFKVQSTNMNDMLTLPSWAWTWLKNNAKNVRVRSCQVTHPAGIRVIIDGNMYDPARESIPLTGDSTSVFGWGTLELEFRTN